MRTFLIIAATIAMSGAAFAAPHCVKGTPCGNTCIAAGKVCHMSPAPAPHCSKGKACGNSCIAKEKVCHK